ncbi:hypothetical protein Tco_1364719 [Tanacetum coccineum]
MNDAMLTTYSYYKAYSSVKRPFNKKTANYNRYFNKRVNTVKASASWVWKPKHEELDHVFKSNSASKTLTRYDYVDALGRKLGFFTNSKQKVQETQGVKKKVYNQQRLEYKSCLKVFLISKGLAFRIQQKHMAACKEVRVSKYDFNAASDEDSFKLIELMILCTNFLTMVHDLENLKTTYLIMKKVWVRMHPNRGVLMMQMQRLPSLMRLQMMLETRTTRFQRAIRSEEVFGYILLVINKLLMKKLDD